MMFKRKQSFIYLNVQFHAFFTIYFKHVLILGPQKLFREHACRLKQKVVKTQVNFTIKNLRGKRIGT